MNEEYLKGLYEHLGGGPVIGAPFEVWSFKIQNNEMYKRGMYDRLNSAGGMKADYKTWNEKVFGQKKKDELDSPQAVLALSTPTEKTPSFLVGHEQSQSRTFASTLGKIDPPEYASFDPDLDSEEEIKSSREGLYKKLESFQDQRYLYDQSQKNLYREENLLRRRVDSGERSGELDSLIINHNKKTKELDAIGMGMERSRIALKEERRKIDKASANLLKWKQNQGTRAGDLYNSVLRGVGRVLSASAEIWHDGAMTPGSVNYGASSTPPSKVKEELLPQIRELLVEAIGSPTTKEHTDKWRETFIGGALTGLAESLPLMVAGPTVGTALFGLSAMDAASEEMANNPAFDDVSEAEKYMVKLPIGVVNGVLESYGLRNIINGSTLTKQLTLKVLKKTGKKTTAKTFGEMVDREVKSLVKRGALRVRSAGLAEFETGALQEFGEVSIKEIYDLAKTQEMFENPEIFSKEMLGQMAYAGGQEMIGGLF